MVIPIIILVAIPIFIGIVFVSPFDQPKEFNDEIILEPKFNDEVILEPKFNDEVILVEEPDMNIPYFLLLGIWAIILLRIIVQIKKGTFKAIKRY
ncbi:MAG: hypothetical protein IIB02_05025 [Thaumarchaeota archaeon]|nr:hypothetical protein [Nitrososphaerota archaeon]